MKCPKCHSKRIKDFGTSVTLVGYSSFIDDEGHEHHHDDNCMKRGYHCLHCGHRWMEALRRRCNVEGCDWRGKETCWCHEGKKVEAWGDSTKEEQ